MKNCESIQESLGAWLDGELKQADAEAMRLHVDGCPACTDAQKKLLKLNVAMKAAHAPAGEIAFEPFWLGVRTRIEEKRSWTTDWAEWLRSMIAPPSLAWAVPAVIVLLLAIFSYDNFLPGRGQRNNFAAVESIDAHGRSVALLREDETKTTVIWLYQNPEGDNEATSENAKKGPTF
ncbi:MAG: zf-HC2 domain-containing protein [Deltaproteobacteria bacterium]|nr:zf-HC2 domain-containing protein [Deltaproteobacteria bacterium]